METQTTIKSETGEVEIGVQRMSIDNILSSVTSNEKL